MTEPDPQPTTDQIAALREEHIGRLFLRAHRSFSESAYHKLNQRGHEGLTITHTSLLANLDIDGTRITTLAERAGVTKQAMGQLVDDLEQRGYVERIPDPVDGRAIRVIFTALGRQFLQDAYYVKQEIEDEYMVLVGEEGMAQLRKLLFALLDNSPK